MNHQDDSMSHLRHERAVYRYVTALDSGDLDQVAEVLAQAEHDPELDRILVEVNASLHEEVGLQPVSEEGALVRQLLRKHLPSAFEEEDVAERPLTVGDVAAHLQADHASGQPMLANDVVANEQLRQSLVALPGRITAQSIKELVAQLSVSASTRYWELFRRAALRLSISRERSRAQLAAARQQRRKRRDSKE